MTGEIPRAVELEQHVDGMHSPFWQAYVAYVEREWGPAGVRYQQAVKAAAQAKEAVTELQKVLYAQEQILLLMQWPRERLNHLRQTAASPAGRP